MRIQKGFVTIVARGFWNSGTLPGFCNMTKPQVKNNVSLPCLLTTLNLHSSAYQTQCLLPRVPSFPLHCTMLSFVHFCPVYHHTTFSYLLNRPNSVERGLASTPLFIIPGFSLHFPLELSYGYLRFEGNGKIPLGRQGKRSLKGRAYSKK